MSAPTLKPEYGPTLGQLLAPRLRALSPPGRLAAAVLAALALVGLIAIVAIWPRAVNFSNTRQVAFNVSYKAPLRRLPAEPGQLLKLEQDRGTRFVQSLAVSPLLLAPYEGDAAGALPVYTYGYLKSLAARRSDFQLLSEGKTRVNGIPAYAVIYQATYRGRVVFGRDVMILPDMPGARRGAVVSLLAVPSGALKSADLLGAAGTLGDALHSFAFGS